MTTIYYTIEEPKCPTIHVENYKRVMIPAKNIMQKYPMISSNDCQVNAKEINNFLESVYSSKYINYILSYKPSETICDICECKTDTSLQKCTFCGTANNKSMVKNYMPDDHDTLFTSHTPEEIINTCKILIDILKKQDHYVYALIRPPGHHSSFDHHSGFCFVNNAYLLAKNLGGNVLIFDWDLHHGDGTENLILKNSDENIYYASMHGYGNGFYPGTGTLMTKNIMNIPLRKGTGNREYTYHFDNLFKPFYNTIDVDTIIISNGLDGHQDDNMNFLNLTDETYLYMTTFFKETNKRLIFLLVGGYNVNVITNVSMKLLDLLNK